MNSDEFYECNYSLMLPFDCELSLEAVGVVALLWAVGAGVVGGGVLRPLAA